MMSLSAPVSRNYQATASVVRFGSALPNKEDAPKDAEKPTVVINSGRKYVTNWGAGLFSLFLAGLSVMCGREANSLANTPIANSNSIFTHDQEQIKKPDIDDAVLQQRLFTYVTDIKKQVQLNTTDDLVAELLKKLPDLTKEEIDFTKQLMDEYKALPLPEKNPDTAKTDFLKMRAIANKWVDKIIEPRYGKDVAFRMKASVDNLSGNLGNAGIVGFGLASLVFGLLAAASTTFVQQKNED